MSACLPSPFDRLSRLERERKEDTAPWLGIRTTVQSEEGFSGFPQGFTGPGMQRSRAGNKVHLPNNTKLLFRFR